MAGRVLGRVVGLVALVGLAVLAAAGVAGGADDAGRIYVSANTSGSVGGVSFRAEDILAYDVASGEWSTFFDGSDVGLQIRGIDAVYVDDDGDGGTLDAIYLSVDRGFPLAGATANDHDILLFTPTSLGTDTAGSFTMYFDGSDVGMAGSGANIDAFTFSADGRLLISADKTEVPGPDGRALRVEDEDVLAFEPTQLGWNTSGRWSPYLDGSDVGLDLTFEDVWGLSRVSGSDDLYMTTAGRFKVAGLRGDGNDIFLFSPDTLGARTAGTFAGWFDGDDYPNLGAQGLALDAISVAPGTALAPSNTPPVAVDDAFETDEDTGITTGNVLRNDTDADRDRLRLQSVDTNGTIGLVARARGGRFVYNPAGLLDHLAVGETYDDTFTYVVTDGQGGTDTATVTIRVSGVNDPPEAVDDEAATDEDNATTIVVTANDTDIDGDELEVASVDDSGVAGTVALDADGVTVVYDPNDQFEDLNDGDTATETFTYEVADGNGGTDTATVTITILGDDEANEPPIANPDQGITDEVTAAGHVIDLVVDDLADPTGVAIDPATGNIVVVDAASGELVVYDSAGVRTGLVVEGFDRPNGVAIDPTTGDIAVADTGAARIVILGDDGTPTGLIIEPQDPPYGVAFGPTGTTPSAYLLVGEGLALSEYDSAGTRLSWDPDYSLPLDVAVDPATGAWAVAELGGPYISGFSEGGAFYIEAEGLEYPEAVAFDPTTGNIVAGDTGTYRVMTFDFDGNTTAPVIAGLTYPDGLAVDAAGNILVADYPNVLRFGDSLLANDIDPDGDPLIVSAFDATSAEGATVVVNADGTYSYDPSTSATIQTLGEGESLEDTFTYTISDGDGGTDVGTVTITINALGLNEPPVAVDDSATTDEETAVAVDVTANDTDADDDDLSVESVDTDGVLGLVTIEADGDTITYDPNGQFEYLGDFDTAEETFSYVVSDGNGGTATATVTVTITGIDDINRDPVANADEGITDEATVAGHVFALVIGGSEVGGLHYPTGIGVDPSTGNIVVADSGNDRVVVYDDGGVPTGLVIDTPYDARGVAVDPSNGNIVVAAGWGNRVEVFDNAGSPTGVVIDGLNVPTDVAIDPATGNIVVADSYNGRVAVYDKTGAATGIEVNGLSFPDGVAIDPTNGNIVVTDTRNDRVVVYSSTGAETGIVIDNVDYPRDVAIDPASGNILVAEADDNRVAVYDSAGSATGMVIDGLHYPGSLAVDPADGDIVIADTYNHRIAVFDATGAATVVIAELQEPSGAAVDPRNGNIVVTDAVGDQVVVFDNSGVPTGIQISDVNHPSDVDVYPATGAIVVADDWSERVAFYDEFGNPTAESYTDFPLSVAAHPSGSAYVGTPSGVDIFEPDGSYGGSAGVPADWAVDVDIDPATGNLVVASRDSGEVIVSGTVDLAIPVERPEAAAWNSTAGNIVVGDTAGGQVVTFDLAGAVVAPVIAGLGNPDGVDVDPATGNIVVADLDRVIVFTTSLLANDTDADGDTLSVSGYDAISVQGATVVVNPDGTYSYDPSTSATIQALGAGETFDDSFGYTVSDGNGGAANATVTLTVTGVADAGVDPVAGPDVGFTDEDTATRFVHLVTVDGLQLPVDVAIDPNTGNLVVAEGEQVVVFDRDRTPTGVAITGYGRPTGLAVDPSTGTIVVAYGLEGNVVTFAADGTPTGVVIGGFLYPDDVAVDPATGNIIVGDSSGVTVFDSSGVPTGVTIADLNAVELAVDPASGNILALVWEGSSTVQVFDSSGVPLGTIISEDNDAFGLAVDPRNGHILVTNTISGTGDDYIAVYDSAGARVETLVGGFQVPHGVVVDVAQDRIVVADYIGYRIVELATTLLSNDSDPNGDTLVVTRFDAVSAEGATVVVNPDGTFVYDPTTSTTLGALEDGEDIEDTFTYAVSDGNEAASTATVTITVIGRPD